MGNVVLPVHIAERLRDRLQQQQTLVKEAELKAEGAMEKYAAAMHENKVLRDVLSLVANGVFDPADAMEKVAEYLRDPMRLEVLKAAHELGLETVPTLGVPEAETGSSDADGGDPISKTLAQLQEDGLIG